MHGCMVIVLAVHIHIYMMYDKTRILLNPFVGLLLGCKSSYTKQKTTHINYIYNPMGPNHISIYTGTQPSKPPICS